MYFFIIILSVFLPVIPTTMTARMSVEIPATQENQTKTMIKSMTFKIIKELFQSKAFGCFDKISLEKAL